MSENDDYSYFIGRKPNKTIVSRSLNDGLFRQKVRIASRIVDGDPGLEFAQVESELVVRETRGGRYQIKATFLENDRGIKSLTVQKYTGPKWYPTKQYFTFVGKEIAEFAAFLTGIRTIPFENAGKRHITDDELREMILNRAQISKLVSQHEDLVDDLLKDTDLKRDLVAVGYRRRQLERFERLLSDKEFFNEEMERLVVEKPEALWQSFFEANQWIFGYGFSLQFLTGLNAGKLEQIVRGGAIDGPGKRSDALMKTRGRLSSVAFVEIKRHDTELLGANSYRSGAWRPSSELVGAVAQVHATVQDAIEMWGRILRPTDKDGNPTGEVLFNVQPRAFVVAGNTEEFLTEGGINELKFRSFELYRQNMTKPEIITYDELLERARFIVEQAN